MIGDGAEQMSDSLWLRVGSMHTTQHIVVIIGVVPSRTTTVIATFQSSPSCMRYAYFSKLEN